MNFGMEKGRLTKKVRRTINDVQRPPKTLDVWTAEIFADLSGPTNSILQRRIDINTGVRCHDESEPSCAHGVVVCVDEIEYRILDVSSNHFKTQQRFFGNGGKLLTTFPLIWCCVMYSR